MFGGLKNFNEISLMDDLFIVINTCKTYFTNINDLLKQIDASGFNKGNVLVVSGQEDETTVFYHEGYRVVKVDYTGLQLTGLIYIHENISSFPNIKYWMLLPDTIRFGENFFNNVRIYYDAYLKGKEVVSLPFINPMLRPTMDMGIVNTSLVMNLGNYLKNIKTQNMDMDNLVRLKRQLILDENTALGLMPQCYIISTKFCFLRNFARPSEFITNHRDDLVETLSEDGKINEVYFKKLDLYKFQKNFRGSNTKLIMGNF